MGQAELAAAGAGATVISNSWGAHEWSTETQYDSYWNRPGIPTVFGSGDSGYGSFYPAASIYAVAAGGTTLTLAKHTGSYRSESVWGGAGSACSLYESAGAWQTSLASWSATGC